MEETNFRPSYNNIKILKGIKLDNYKTIKRMNYETGISTSNYGKYWFMLPKGRAIFKTYDNYRIYEPIRYIRIANELLCYQLSKQMGILCAEYELANKDNFKGVVTYDIKGKDEMLISAQALFREFDTNRINKFYNYLKVLEELKKRGYKADENKFLLSLYKISLFDTLTLQTDRHSNNVFFLLNKKKKTVKLAPILDNELAFCSGVNYETLQTNYYIDPISIKNYMFQIDKFVEVRHNVTKQNFFMENIKNLVDLAKTNKKMKKILITFIDNYDIDKAVSCVKQQGVEINSSYIKYIKDCKDVVVNLIQNELKQNSEIKAKKTKELIY